MCGRYTREFSWGEIEDFLDPRFPNGVSVDSTGDLEPSFNVAPTQANPVAQIIEPGEPLRLTLRRWGLLPHWAKDPAIGSRMINARSETVTDKPAYRVAFSKRRCIVPVSSFYEWEAIEGQKTKQAWRNLRADGAVMLFAGLWEPPNDHAPDGTHTLMTTAANPFMAEIHDRMPVILEPEDAPTWCDPDTPKDEARALLKPAADGVLIRHKVSTRVNTPRNNDADLIAEIQ